MNDERRQVDPQGAFPSEGLREVERNALRVLRCMPGAGLSRTRDVIQAELWGEEGIVVLVTAEAFEIRLPTIEWTMGAYGPADASRLWKRVRADALSDGQLLDLIEAGLEARRAEFVACRFCGRLFPVEHRSGDACHDCASRHLGIVY